MEIGVRKHGVEGMLASLRIQPTLIERIKEAQLVDSALQKVRANIETGLSVVGCNRPNWSHSTQSTRLAQLRGVGWWRRIPLTVKVG
ncbi:hypothetical protein CCACVL1_18186 [Corchorus capsularis]|uniref:Uncharacterized protein n=1 Tax=Corchorus capsularis TaxID=210143 RepID=A0A1R3HMH0_COCAP|nr:hypothetical protein CCACVL1_18186 [Corchorus capsularis]